ncbi:MAG: DUF1801 domain-containing protein [Bacteroidota bacterium]|jgi:uncharacterized protein YdhG (YjbR/CyaY superfamily)
MKKHTSVDAYIAEFSGTTRKKLKEIRTIIRAAAPDAEEVISYNMPAYKQNGVLVYFAGYERHIGFYPTGSGIKAFRDRFKKYAWSKGAVQFPLDAPLPVRLITAIVKFRIEQTLLKAKEKK